MQERQVTVDGVRHPLPEPFFVLATQNPIELEGTFPLPEAQLDRFLLRVRLGYPNEEQEERILTTTPAPRRASARRARRRSRDPRPADLVAGVALEHPVRSYIVSLARATRDHPELSVGASPRAVAHLGDAARAWALLRPRLRAAGRREGAGGARARPPAGADHRRTHPRPDRRRDPPRGPSVRPGPDGVPGALRRTPRSAAGSRSAWRRWPPPRRPRGAGRRCGCGRR